MKNKENFIKYLFLSSLLIFVLLNSLNMNVGFEYKIMVIIAYIFPIFIYFILKYNDKSKFNVYYESYLKTTTDTLAIATKEMKYIENVDRMSDNELLFHLGVIIGSYRYLESINPPTKYEKEHKEMIRDLYYFVEDNKLRLKK